KSGYEIRGFRSVDQTNDLGLPQMRRGRGLNLCARLTPGRLRSLAHTSPPALPASSPASRPRHERCTTSCVRALGLRTPPSALEPHSASLAVPREPHTPKPS